MHPVALTLGSFEIRWYGVMAAIGFLAATWVISWNRERAKLSADQATTLVMLAMITGVIGARVFYVVQFFDQFRGHFWRVFRIDQGGLVFYGGFFLAAVSIVAYCLKKRLDLIRVGDVMMPALAIGHAAGRVGCFLNGCCFGKPTACWVGVGYPDGTAPALRYGAQLLHPVQLYEAGANLVLFAILLVLVRRGRRGAALSAYVIGYGVMRFLDEFFRGDHRQFWNGFTPAQVIGLVLVPVGIALWIGIRRYGRRETA